MIDGFGLDDTIKLIFDGEIVVKPGVPLNKEEQDYLIEKTYKNFHKEMKYRLFISNCLESKEIQEYKYNPLFLQGRAFIFMSRCLNRFDKGRYKGQEFGILHGKRNKMDLYDFEFARDFNLLIKNDAGFTYKDIFVGSCYESLKLALSKNSKLENDLKINVALSRLKFFWTNFYRDSINQLAGETIKWKKYKGIPTKPDLKKSGVEPIAYIDTLKKLRDHQVKSRTAPEFTENQEENPFTFERYNQLEDELMTGKSIEFRRFFFCSNVLKMEHQEMVLEFGDQFKILREEEMKFKQELKKNNGI